MPTDTNSLPSIADQVRRARHARGLTIRAFADEAGISPGTLQRIESGEDAKISILQRIASSLGSILLIGPSAPSA